MHKLVEFNFFFIINMDSKKNQPDECYEQVKKLKRYLKDTKFFLEGCDKCPIAQKLLITCNELHESIEKNHPTI